MSINTYSPVLTLFFAVSLLWILMDLHYQELSSFERKWFPASILLLAIFVHVLYSRMGGPAFSKSILFILMFTGACAGSTAGGFKLSRVIILFKTIKKECHRLIHPHSVKSINFEAK